MISAIAKGTTMVENMVENLEEKKAKEVDNIIHPSTKTDLTSSNNSTDKTCIFVFREDGKWEVGKKLFALDAGWDGSGWLIPIKHKKAAEKLCADLDMVSFEMPIPEDFEIYKASASIGLLESKVEITEREIKALCHKEEIECNDIDGLYYIIKDMPINENVKKIKRLLCELTDLHKKITYASNNRLVKQATQETSNPIESKFEYLLENNSEEKLRKELITVSPCIQTGYNIGGLDLEFPGGALSIIAAPTSHGKTTVLINFSLGVLEKNTTKHVYFFSYEEACPFILMSFLNTWIGEEITLKNNKKSIEEYFRNGTTQYIKQDKQTLFKERKDLFFEQLINPGRLKVSYSDMRVEELIRAISFIKEKDTHACLICIDYMQLLRLEKRITNRQEELKDICEMLKNCSISTGLPIVLAAQFNRTVVTEADALLTNIGEAGDIERYANLVIGMFNRNFIMTSTGNIGKNKQKIEQESAIYMEILKGRRDGNNYSCVMDFDGNLGRIKPREKDPTEDFLEMKKKQQKQYLDRQNREVGLTKEQVMMKLRKENTP